VEVIRSKQIDAGRREMQAGKCMVALSEQDAGAGCKVHEMDRLPIQPAIGRQLRDMNEANAIVFVVDDDLSVRRSTERLIRSAGLEVQSFPSAREFLKNPRPARPACLVLDVRMPGLSGTDLQQELNRAGIYIPIIFVTGHGNIPMSVRAMKSGAVEFLTKPFRSPTLLAAVRSAIEQDRLARISQSEIEELRGRYKLLTPREREVLPLVAAGLLNKQVASELGTTERTIKFHRAHIMQKAHAESLADLVRMVEKLGIESKVGHRLACPKVH
jgi:FixJ family two-component response regulator